jgi:phosphoglucosamine mutase
VKVREKRPIKEVPRLSEAIQRVADALREEGRVVVRYSGTEPKLRIMVEGMNEERVREYADELEALAIRYLAEE